MDRRMLERRLRVRRDRQRRRLRRTVLVGLAVLVVVALVLIERSPLVGLAEVRVRGVQRLEAAAVRAAADLQLGTSTLRLPLAEAESRVESLPAVRRARARRVDPLTVEIVVSEREPVARVVGRGAPVLVDAEGIVLAEAAHEPLVEIQLGRRPVPDPGRPVTASPALATAHRVLMSLSPDLRERVERYEARAADGLVLVLGDGTRVRFGRADDVAAKQRALRVVLDDLDDRGVTAVDVRTPAHPVVEP